MRSPACLKQRQQRILPVIGMVVFSCLTPARLVGQDKPGEGNRTSASRVISEEALKRCNAIILDAVDSNDPVRLIPIVDRETFERRVVQDVEGNPDVIAKFTTKSFTNFFERWVSERNSKSRNGSFVLRRKREFNGEMEVVYRLVDVAGGASYSGLILRCSVAGDPLIVDFHDFASGELFSDSLRRELKRFLAGIGPEIGDVPTPGQQEFSRKIRKREVFERLVNAHEPRAALLAFEEIPEEWKNDRRVLFLRMQAARELHPGGSRHATAIHDLVANAGGESSLHFVLMDYYLQANDLENELRVADLFRSEVGADSWIDSQISSAYLRTGDAIHARRLANAAVQREPNLISAQMILMEVAVRQGDFATAVQALSRSDTIRPIHSLDQFEQNPDPNIARLISSREYQQWKSSRPRKNQQPSESPPKTNSRN